MMVFWLDPSDHHTEELTYFLSYTGSVISTSAVEEVLLADCIQDEGEKQSDRT